MCKKNYRREPHNFTPEQLAQDSIPKDCWVALHGTFYYMTDFLEEHPTRAQSFYDLGGKDGTAAFEAVYDMGMKWEHFWLPQVK